MRSLSVIVPCLNEAKRIAGSLAALQPLRDHGAQVIVVDGGSTDETVALARAHADLVIESKRGRAAQMNAGAAVARGDVLLFLHADTTLPARADELISDALRHAAWGRFDVWIAGVHPLLRVISSLMNLRSRLTGIATGDQAIFVEHATFLAMGGYSDIALMEDIELSARLRKRARPACIHRKVITSGRRWETHGVLRTVVLMWRIRFAYWLGADPARLALRYDEK